MSLSLRFQIRVHVNTPNLETEVGVHVHVGEADHTPHCVVSVQATEGEKPCGRHVRHEGLQGTENTEHVGMYICSLAPRPHPHEN